MLLLTCIHNNSNTAFITTIMSLIGAIIGGICSILGVVFSTVFQQKQKDKLYNNKIKKSVMIEYYSILSSYYIKIASSSDGNIIYLQNLIEEMETTLLLNNELSLHLKNWINGGYEDFVLSITNKLKSNQNMRDIKNDLLNTFKNEMNKIKKCN